MSLTTRLSPQECAERLTRAMSPDGIGAAIRSLRGGQIRPWIGTCDGRAFRVSKGRHPLADTTYAPVMSGEMVPVEGGGTLLTWEFSLYPGSRCALSVLWTIVGIFIGVNLVGQAFVLLTRGLRLMDLVVDAAPLILGGVMVRIKISVRRKCEMERGALIQFLKETLEASERPTMS